MECYLDKDLIFKNLSAKDSKSAINIMASELFEKGLVKEDYINEVISREEVYPTGLYTGDINVAIPHCDYQFVNKKSIAVGILERPIKFKKMDEPSEDVEVSIIIMLAIDEPDNHIAYLTKVFQLVQNQDVLKKIYSSNDDQILEILNENL